MKFITGLLLIISCLGWASFSPHAKEIMPSQVGAEQTQLYFPKLKNKRIGLVVNQTSRAKQQHLVDLLVSNNFEVKKIFAPEHGFRGDHDAGAHINSGKDSKTGIDIVSIYGKHKKPSAQHLADLDVIVFDIQDVGVRFYTYISSMFYVMQAAAQHNVEMIVLDRPNPNIAFVDGPMLNPKFRSFVGLLPVPIMHGMTVGELAQMTLHEGWLDTIENPKKVKHNLKLEVISVNNYARQDSYTLPVLPSPNLPNQQAIALYPSLCLFEATPVSVGRGTDFPFQVLGHNQHFVGDFTFSPRSIPGVSTYPKLEGKKLTGVDLRRSKLQGFDLSHFYQWFTVFNTQQTDFFSNAQFLDKLAGTDQIRLDMLNGKSLDQIKQAWQQDLQAFKQQRQRYLLYP